MSSSAKRPGRWAYLPALAVFLVGPAVTTWRLVVTFGGNGTPVSAEHLAAGVGRDMLATAISVPLGGLIALVTFLLRLRPASAAVGVSQQE